MAAQARLPRGAGLPAVEASDRGGAHASPASTRYAGSRRTARASRGAQTAPLKDSSDQRDTFAHPNHRVPGDLVVPGLLARIEDDPEEAEPRHRHRQEAAECPNDRRLPIDGAI